jgi:hypothetical protein
LYKRIAFVLFQPFARRRPSVESFFTVWCFNVAASMNITLLRARRWSLALLLIGLLSHEHLLADYAGTVPTSGGLLRLGRDLMRRTSGSETAEKTETAEEAAQRWRI